MSRSNPTDPTPNPSTRWLEWHGGQGFLVYYDATTKQKVKLPLPFVFLLLDELKTVRGWDDKSKSRVYANEVRNLSEEPLVVKAFKGGTLARGLYSALKDTDDRFSYHSSLYIAIKIENPQTDRQYTIANLGLKGAALGAWITFKKTLKPEEVYSKAISLKSYSEETNGGVTYRVPVFALTEISPAAQEAALALDKQLQAYLASYSTRDHDAAPAEGHAEEPEPPPPTPAPIDASDIPF